MRYIEPGCIHQLKWPHSEFWTAFTQQVIDPLKICNTFRYNSDTFGIQPAPRVIDQKPRCILGPYRFMPGTAKPPLAFLTRNR